MKPKKSSADNLLHKTILLFLQFLLPVNCFVVISTGKILQPNTTIVKSSLESTVEVVISTDKILQPNTTIFKLSLESTVEAGLESVMKTMSPTETSHGKSKLSTVIGMTIYLLYLYYS